VPEASNGLPQLRASFAQEGSSDRVRLGEVHHHLHDTERGDLLRIDRVSSREVIQQGERTPDSLVARVGAGPDQVPQALREGTR